MNQSTDVTQKSRTHVLTFLPLLTPSVQKMANLHGFKSIYIPSNINAAFSQWGSWLHGSTSHQQCLWRVSGSAVYPMQWMELIMMCCRMTVNRKGELGVCVRKMKALTMKMEKLTLNG